MIGNATASTLVDEIIFLTKYPGLPIKPLFLALPKYFNALKFPDGDRLRMVTCLPVRNRDGEVSRKSSLDRFFIPDQQSLVDNFRDSVPLLDFSVDEVRHLKPLFESLQIMDKSLRACVKSSWEPVGIPHEDGAMVKLLQSKSELLCR